MDIFSNVISGSSNPGLAGNIRVAKANLSDQISNSDVFENHIDKNIDENQTENTQRVANNTSDSVQSSSDNNRGNAGQNHSNSEQNNNSAQDQDNSNADGSGQNASRQDNASDTSSETAQNQQTETDTDLSEQVLNQGQLQLLQVAEQGLSESSARLGEAIINQGLATNLKLNETAELAAQKEQADLLAGKQGTLAGLSKNSANLLDQDGYLETFKQIIAGQKLNNANNGAAADGGLEAQLAALQGDAELGQDNSQSLDDLRLASLNALLNQGKKSADTQGPDKVIDVFTQGPSTLHQTAQNTSPLTSGVVNPAGLPQHTPQVPISSVAVHIAAQAQNGVRRFDIRLDPPELGRIDVRLDVARDGSVNTHIIVERSETLDLMQRDARQLERALNESGLDTKEGELTFSLKDQGFADDHNEHYEEEGQGKDTLDDEEHAIQSKYVVQVNDSTGRITNLDIRI